MRGDRPSYAWPVTRLSEAVEALARHVGLPVHSHHLPPAPEISGANSRQRVGEWMDAVASALGIEAEPVAALHGELEQVIVCSGPSVLMLSGGEQPSFLLLMGGKGRRVRVLGPDRRVIRVDVAHIKREILDELEANAAERADKLLECASVPPSKRVKARRALLNEWFSRATIGGFWFLRLPPSSGLWRQMLEARLPRRLVSFFCAHIATYFVMIVSWVLVGQTALQGHIDVEWLLAWFLIMITQAPLGLIVSWSEGMFAIGLGGILKKRLLFGALKLDPAEIRHQGAGQLLGKVIESGALESMALAAGFAGLTALIDLVGAGVVLGLGAGGGLRLLLFAFWVVVTAVIGIKYYRQRLPWTDARVEMTNDLVERMVGHRTRIAQERRENWHEGEDQYLSRYLDRSRKLDNTTIQFQALLSRGWLFVGVVGLVPVFFDHSASRTEMAVALGGILLASRALSTLASSLSALTGAAVAWKQVAPLYQAAGRREEMKSAEAALGTIDRLGNRDANEKVMEVHDIAFRYRPQGEPVLKGCSLDIRGRERILLEGPSGGGKTTLASVLVGLREPESGLMLLGGFDRQTLGGEGWRRQVVAAPQFHENHVMTGTFAFNALMGRSWPPEPGDLEEAEEICRELGLGPLLDRMPAGMLQVVGETGWRLSHGERSRLFIARALLQKADLIVLDESFAALDPESLKQALQCVLRRAPSLLVIAHP